MKAEELEKMPTIQIVALHVYREYREAYEEELKWAYAPEALTSNGFEKAVARCKTATERMDRLFFRGLLHGLVNDDPVGLAQVYTTYGRFDRRIAILRCLEALRLHAAVNEGKWPTALREVTE